MKMKGKRIIGLDMPPDVFAAAALVGTDPAEAKTQWVHDREDTTRLEAWAKKHLRSGDTVVLEASGNSFAVASRLHALGHTALVLESAPAGKIRDNCCNDDRHSAVKLAQPSGLSTALAVREWSELQCELLRQKFEQLWAGEQLRRRCEQIMVRELCAHPEWARLWRLMGVRHRVAFALMALIGDIHRFATAKQLVGYFGLASRRVQSGNNARGRECGLGHTGRGDVRALLIQSAQNAMNQRSSPLPHWGWKLRVKKTRNLAVARRRPQVDRLHLAPAPRTLHPP